MEIIPQHIYTYGDGVPAYKSGEWPGSKPCHFIGSKLILRPIKQPEKEFTLGHSKHFLPKYSDEFKFKKGLKLIPPYIHEYTYKPAKRRLKPIKTEPIIRFRNRSYRPKDQFYSTNIAPFLQKKLRINQNIPNNTEYGVESVMNRKKRILSLEEQRNNLQICKPGDKNYNCVENCPEFFKMEGLVPGSTHRINVRKNMKKGDDNFFQTLNLNLKILNRNKLWTSKKFLESLDFDKKYVEDLNNWENKVFEDNNPKKNDNKEKEK